MQRIGISIYKNYWIDWNKGVFHVPNNVMAARFKLNLSGWRVKNG